MEKQTLINKISAIIVELTEITKNFDKTDKISQIDIDLSMEKVRKLYDELQKLKSYNVNIIEKTRGNEPIISKNEEVVAKQQTDNSIKKPSEDIIENESKVIEEKPVLETTENEDEAINKESTTIIIENNDKAIEVENVGANEYTGNIQQDASQISMFDTGNTEQKVETVKQIKIEVATKEVDESVTNIEENISTTDSIVESDNFLNQEKDDVEESLAKNNVTKSSTVGEKLIDNKKTINDIFTDFKKTKDLSTHLQYQPIKEMKSVISLNDKIRFIKELFQSSSENYANSINKLDSFTNLDEALEYLNNNFEWNDTKASFKDFLELVYRRFLPVIE